MKLTKTVAVAVLVAAAAAATTAFATIPDGGGVIHGCYQKLTGQLRVVDTTKGATCNGFEAPLAWSQTGPQGPQGDPGPQGPKGDKGDKGDPGSAGVLGYERVLASQTFTLQPTEEDEVFATCPNGKKVLGGGGDAGQYSLRASMPWGDTGWEVVVWNKTNNTVQDIVYAYALCATVN